MAAEISPGGKKPLLKNPVTWIVVLAGVLIVGGIILYRNMQASSASSSDTSGDTSSDDSGTDDSGALGTLQTEIGDLQSSAGQVVVPNVAGDTAAVATTVINGAGLSAANPGGTPGTNIVSGTSPAAGSSVASGTVVNISSAPAQKANGTPVKTSGPVTPVSPAPPKTTTSQNEYSWTDTGQKESLTALAKALGVSVSALKPTNASAKKAASQPTRDIPKGAKFTYVKQPKTVTTS
jgi:hypothetical protein